MVCCIRMEQGHASHALKSEQQVGAQSRSALATASGSSRVLQESASYNTAESSSLASVRTMQQQAGKKRKGKVENDEDEVQDESLPERQTSRQRRRVSLVSGSDDGDGVQDQTSSLYSKGEHPLSDSQVVSQSIVRARDDDG